MKKFLLVSLVTLLGAYAGAQGGQIRGVTQTNTQSYAKIMSGATVTVYPCTGSTVINCPDPSTVTAINLYLNQSLTTPVPGVTTVTSDVNGNYQFWVPIGTYNLCVSGTSYTTFCQKVWVATGGTATMVYPASGVPQSTGSAWGTSLQLHGAGNYVQTSDGSGNIGNIPVYTTGGMLSNGFAVHGIGTSIQTYGGGGSSAGHCAQFIDGSGTIGDAGQPCGGGGSGTPGGSNLSLQYNNLGSLGGFGQYNSTSNAIILGASAITAQYAYNRAIWSDLSLDSGSGTYTTNYQPSGLFVSRAANASTLGLTNPFALNSTFNSNASDGNYPSGTIWSLTVNPFGFLTWTLTTGTSGAQITPNQGAQFFQTNGITSTGTGVYVVSNPRVGATGTVNILGTNVDAEDQNITASGAQAKIIGQAITVNNWHTSTQPQQGLFVNMLQGGGSTTLDKFRGVEINGPTKSFALLLDGGTARLAQDTFANMATCNSTYLGAIIEITDSTTSVSNDVVAGGGSNQVVSRCDGTNWRVLGGPNSPHTMVNVGIYTISGASPFVVTIPSSYGITSAAFCQPNPANSTAAAYTGVQSTTGSNQITLTYTGSTGGQIWFACSQS